MPEPRTLFQKVWDSHVVTRRDDGAALLYIDRQLLHEGSRYAFDSLVESGHEVRRPNQTFACADHYVPTRGHDNTLASIRDDSIRSMVEQLRDNSQRTGVPYFGLGSPKQGIVHVVGPELGITQPGLTMVCGDSHTSTHGAFGALAFGIGASEVGHVLATQTLWQHKPMVMEIRLQGTVPAGVTSKDVILHVIGQIGADGATGYAVEFGGAAIEAMTMEERMTVCNMAIEAGARSGMVAPDDVTYAYLKGREYAPSERDWDAAVAYWQSLATDEGATFDRRVTVEVGSLVPTVTWGTSPEDTVPVNGAIPNPELEGDNVKRSRMYQALRYMALEPGQSVLGLKVDRVFIGSCTNGRLSDLRAAAAVLENRRVLVPTLVVPGSATIRSQAEAEGLHRVFVDAGCEWGTPGCSMCLGVNGDTLSGGERCASTSNRNFEGRQGKGGRTHLMSPAMAAAAAVQGRISDVREIMGEV